MKRACAIVLVLLLTLSAVGCTGQNQQQDSVYKTNLMLDTIVQITLYDWEDSSTIDLAFDEIRRLESLLSVEQEAATCTAWPRPLERNGWRFPRRRRKSSACRKSTIPFLRSF